MYRHLCFALLCVLVVLGTPFAALAEEPSNLPHRLFVPLTRNGSSQDSVSDPLQLTAEEAEVLRLVNQERANAGCGSLQLSMTLVQVARNHSLDMATNDFFSHTNLVGQSPFDRMHAAGYTYYRAGENIAAGYSSAQLVMNGWMHSQGHRGNILNCDYTEIGIGMVFDSNDGGTLQYRYYWTQLFAQK